MTYLLYCDSKLGINDPTDGNRTILVDPFKKEESPYGWHNTKTKKFTTARGNNGYSILNGDADEKIDFLKAYSPEGKAELKFDFPFDQNEKNVSKIADAAAVQVFYLTNIVSFMQNIFALRSKLTVPSIMTCWNSLGLQKPPEISKRTQQLVLEAMPPCCTSTMAMTLG